jgi:hypothetical protein
MPWVNGRAARACAPRTQGNEPGALFVSKVRAVSDTDASPGIVKHLYVSQAEIARYKSRKNFVLGDISKSAIVAPKWHRCLNFEDDGHTDDFEDR